MTTRLVAIALIAFILKCAVGATFFPLLTTDERVQKIENASLPDENSKLREMGYLYKLESDEIKAVMEPEAD